MSKCKENDGLAQDCSYSIRNRENFGAFTEPKGDFGLILLILYMIIHKSFTGPTQFLPVNVRGPVSFAVFAPLLMQWSYHSIALSYQ